MINIGRSSFGISHGIKDYMHEPNKARTEQDKVRIWLLNNLIADKNTTEILIRIRNKCVELLGTKYPDYSFDSKPAHEIYFDIIDHFLDDFNFIRGYYLAIIYGFEIYPKEYVNYHLRKFFLAIIKDKYHFVYWYHLVISVEIEKETYKVLPEYEGIQLRMKYMYLKLNFRFVLEVVENSLDVRRDMMIEIHWFHKQLKEIDPKLYLYEDLSRAFKKRILKKLNEPFLWYRDLPDDLFVCEQEVEERRTRREIARGILRERLREGVTHRELRLRYDNRGYLVWA